LTDRQPLPAPTLVVNPLYDARFVHLAHALAASGITDAHRLQVALRASYAAVVVRARELSGEQATVLYVYRDGHWVNGSPQE
jgi:hypothetical protein